jgi:peptidoglycan pentaglycine glycine transferase (the first glycine)
MLLLVAAKDYKSKNFMKNSIDKFIQDNSPDGGFLQSEEWRKFQESIGRKTFHMEHDGFWANVIEHQLPIVGKYFYIPRGPVVQSSAFPFPDKSGNSSRPQRLSVAMAGAAKPNFSNLIDIVRKNNAGWIRIEPRNEEILDLIKKYTDYKIVKAPHDMQPREILVMDITKPEEELLAEMKQKTRYNIRLAEKKNINVISQRSSDIDKKYIDEFIRLVKITAQRDKIIPHPENYYRKMFETIPGGILKLYVAEYNNKIIAANLMVFYVETATYLHGASDDKFRNVMAPYLLQWQAVKDAKAAGFERYDLGGVSTRYNSWAGITKFKTGFALNIRPIEFPGSWDIIISPFKYNIYNLMQKFKSLLK